MGNHSIKPKVVEIAHSQDTGVFALMSPRVFALTLDVIPAIGAHLRWSRSAVTFLADILRQIGENKDTVTLKRADFARALWPDDSEMAGARKLSRHIDALKQCQAFSGFQAVWIESGHKVTGRNGESDRYYPTTYKLREFYGVLREIQDKAIGCDLCALPFREMRARLLTITQQVLNARGFQPLPLPVRKKTEKHATDCEAVGAVDSLASDELPPVKDERVTKETVEADIVRAFETLFESGQRWLMLGLRVNDFIKKVMIEEEDLASRLMKAAKAANGINDGTRIRQAARKADAFKKGGNQ